MPTFAIEILFHVRATNYQEAAEIADEVTGGVLEGFGDRATTFQGADADRDIASITITPIDFDGDV